MGPGGEGADLEVTVQPDTGEVGAGDEVVEIAVNLPQFSVAVLEFVVEGGEFLVGRLELFLGGLQFLVDALKLLVGGEDLLVGGPEFFVGTPQILNHRADVFFSGGQFLLQLPDEPVFGLRSLPVGHRGRFRLARQDRGPGRLLEEDQEEAFLLRFGLEGNHLEVDRVQLAVVAHAQVLPGDGPR